MYADRERTLTDLLTCEGAENDRCADCRSPEVSWVSTNLGAFLCLSCAGHHRNLGVQISMIQSLTLDDSVLRIKDELKKKGNFKVNAKFEARLPSYWLRPRPSVGKGNVQDEESKMWDSIRSRFIVHKYVKRFFQEGKLVVNDPACDRMPQAPYDTVCKVLSVFMGKTRWSNQWLIIVGTKVQLYNTENSLGAPQQLFDVRKLDVKVLDDPDISLEIVRCDASHTEKSTIIAFTDVDTLTKVVHKIRKAAMFYTQFPPKDINECKIDVSDLTIDPVTLRNAESFGWAYHIKGRIMSVSNLKKNRRFWTLIGTKLYKFREDVSQAEEPASPTGGIELEQAHVYLDQTRNNTIIIHTELMRFALMPEQSYLQKMSQLLAQKVQYLQSSRFIDFVDKIPVEVRSQKSGTTTVMVRADEEKAGLEASEDYETKSDENEMVAHSAPKHQPGHPTNSNAPKTQFIGKIEMDNKTTASDSGAEDKLITLQDVERLSLLPPPPPRHSYEGDVPLPPPPPAIQPHQPKPRCSLDPDFKLELKNQESDPPPDDPVGCASPDLPTESVLGFPDLKSSGKNMLVPPEQPTSVPQFKPPKPPLFNAHQKNNMSRAKPPFFQPPQKNSTYDAGPPLFDTVQQKNMSSVQPPLFMLPQKKGSSGVGPPPIPTSVSHQVSVSPPHSSYVLSTMDRSFNKIKQSPPPLPMKVRLGIT